MGQQILDSDRLRIGGRNMKRLEIGVDIRMQVYLPFLDQLHHRRPGKKLTDRAQTKHCSLLERIASLCFIPANKLTIPRDVCPYWMEMMVKALQMNQCIPGLIPLFAIFSSELSPLKKE
jgi:hypothetical protein